MSEPAPLVSDPVEEIAGEAIRSGARAVCLGAFPYHAVEGLLARVAAVIGQGDSGTLVVHEPPVYFDRLSVEENLQLVTATRHDRPTRRQRGTDLLDQLGGVHSTTLGHDARQRVALARALADDPETLVILQPLFRFERSVGQSLARVISERSQQGRRTIYGARRIDVGRSVADMIALVRDGRLGFSGSPAELSERREQALLSDTLGVQAAVASELRLADAAGGTLDERAQRAVDVLEVLVEPAAIALKLNQPGSNLFASGADADDVADLVSAANQIHDPASSRRARIGCVVTGDGRSPKAWVLTTAPAHQTIVPLPLFAAEVAKLLEPRAAPATVSGEPADASVAESASSAPPASLASSNASGQLVLICEDDPSMADVIQAMLDRLEVPSLAFSNATEMADAVQQRAHSVLACIVDQGLPDLPGHELVARIRRFDPIMPIVLVSGSDEIHPSLEQLDSLTALRKPFTLRRLREALRPHMSGSGLSWS